MSLARDFNIGLSSYSKAIRFIRKHRFYWPFLVPLGLNILLFILGATATSSATDWIMGKVDAAWQPDEWDFFLSDFLAGALSGIIWLVIRLLFLLLFAFTAGYLILVLMSPLLAYVSEKTDQYLNDNDYPFSWGQLIKDMLRGIRLALRNLLIELLFMVLFFILGFVPVIGGLSAVGLFLVSAYFYGFSFMDYTSERRKLSVKESIRYVSRNKGLAIGVGFLFGASLFIPVIGMSLSGFIAIISTVAATIAIFEKESDRTNSSSLIK